jgi:hypothetical protein
MCYLLPPTSQPPRRSNSNAKQLIKNLNLVTQITVGTTVNLQIAKIIVIVFCYVIYLTSKYTPQHSVLKSPQSVFVLPFRWEIRSFKPTDKTYKIFSITGFVDSVHRPEFKIARKHNVSETWSVSIFRWGERDTLLGPLGLTSFIRPLSSFLTE